MDVGAPGVGAEATFSVPSQDDLVNDIVWHEWNRK